MTDTFEDNMDFCPSCGKILVKRGNIIRCSKCRFVKEEKSVVHTNKTTYNRTSNSFPVTFSDASTLNSSNFTDNVSNTSSPSEIPKSSKDLVNNERISSPETPYLGYFPYITVRPQQEKIMKSIWEGYKTKSHSIIQAANGVGKTISTLSVLLPIAEKEKKVIVYCCRTHEQMSRVIEEMKMIRQLKTVSAVALRGRKELCLHPLVGKFAIDSSNASEICSYLKKEGKCHYFRNLANRKAMDTISGYVKHQVLDSKDLLELGESQNICPFELAKKFMSEINVVAVSYQYLFNPNIRNTLLNNLDKDFSEIIVVVDEAHNLSSIAIDISTETLSTYSIDRSMSEALKYKAGQIYDLLDALYSVLFSKVKKLGKVDQIEYNPDDLILELEQKSGIALTEETVYALEKLGDVVKEEQIRYNKAPLSYSSSISYFFASLLNTKNRKDYAHFLSTVTAKSGDKYPLLTILSLDPRAITETVFKNAFFTVSISGTLDPVEAYLSLVGLKNLPHTITSLPSPYQSENIMTLITKEVSTRLSDRTSNTYTKMVEVIVSVVEATPKNVGVFCASYSVLNSLLNNGLERLVPKPLFIAQPGMSSKDNDELIERFKNESKRKGGVLLSVLGGRSSEGSDYPGDQMHSVIICGIPYAVPSPMVDASIKYLDSQFPKKGREYGYTISALIRASQAAGRPIRSLSDCAAIILLDHRFGNFYYNKHLPSWLTQNMRIIEANSEEIKKRLHEFFSYHLSAF